MLVAFVLILVKGFNKEERPEDSTDIPSPNQLLFGFKKVGEAECDIDVLKKNILTDDRFLGYGLHDEYCMVYQATDFEAENALKKFIGIKSELPKIEYSKQYMVLSVGRAIEDISDKNKKTTDAGERVVDFTFGDSYSPNAVYVYSMKKTEFLSGNELEIYYLENIHPNCNLEEVSRDDLQLISEGKYHKVYKKADNVYEYVIYGMGDVGVSSRKILDELPVITEYSDTMVKLEHNDKDCFFNPKTNFYTTYSKYNLLYLGGNIVAFAKHSTDGALVLVVRDAYNTANYSYIISPPINCDPKRLNELLQSVEYVDSTHIKVKFFFGKDQPILEETITVPNLDKKTEVHEKM